MRWGRDVSCWGFSKKIGAAKYAAPIGEATVLGMFNQDTAKRWR